MTQEKRPPCADCGHESRDISTASLKKGSRVREPWEHLCANCIASRTTLLRVLNNTPDTLTEIRGSIHKYWVD